MYIIEHGIAALLLPKGGRRMSLTGKDDANAELNEARRLGWRGELRRMQMRQQAEIFVKELKTGDFFGEEAILHENHHVSVRSITYCDLLVLASRDLMTLLQTFGLSRSPLKKLWSSVRTSAPCWTSMNARD